MPVAPAIDIAHLSKTYGTTKAVDSITLSIPKGSIYALIGPNGAGKTTLLKMLAGLLTPEKGNITINGYDIQTHPLEAKKQFSYIPDDPSGYEFLTGREFLVFTGRLLALDKQEIIKRIEILLPLFPLESVIDQQIGSYSRGNREKVVFLSALLAQSDVLIIDEPLVGLDPKSITIFGKKLRDFASSGGTVLFTTHILSFAKDFADTIGVLVNGKIVHQTSMKEAQDLDALYEKYTNEA